MKYVFILLAFAVGIIILSSCNKHKNCYECTTTVYSAYVVEKVTLCDITEEEADMYEEANSSSGSETKCVKE